MLAYDDWLPLCQELKEGRRERVPHECGSGKVMLIEHTTEGYRAYCYRCNDSGFKAHGRRSLDIQLEVYSNRETSITATYKVELPDDITPNIHILGRMWLASGGITNRLIDKYRIGYSEHYGRVFLPIHVGGKLVYYQARAVHKGQFPKYINPVVDKGDIRFIAGSGDIAVVTEDILSAIRVGEIDNYVGVAILGTSPSTADINYLNTYQRVLSWTDPDDAGRKAYRKLKTKLGLLGKAVVRVDTDDDPKIYSTTEMKAILCQSI